MIALGTSTLVHAERSLLGQVYVSNSNVNSPDKQLNVQQKSRFQFCIRDKRLIVFTLAQTCFKRCTLKTFTRVLSRGKTSALAVWDRIPPGDLPAGFFLKELRKVPSSQCLKQIIFNNKVLSITIAFFFQIEVVYQLL